MLSIKRYAWLCVLGTEVAYFLCLGYGLFVNGASKTLHNSLFELLPGFTWGSVGSVIWGAIFLGAIAGIAGSYIAWMHNKSMVSKSAFNN